MKFVIWGAGERGERLFPHIGSENIEVYIDSDERKIGNEILGKKIISFETYLADYRSYWIIVTCSAEEEVVRILKENHIDRFFRMSDCPGEFQEPYPRRLLKQYIMGSLDPEKRYIIYGCTVYSFILNECIKLKTGEYARIIPHQESDMAYIENVQKNLPEYEYLNLNDIGKYDFDELLISVESGMENVYIKTGNKIITNYYDCSGRIENYYYPELKKFKDRHDGRRCFIIATGPSLRMDDLDTLKKHHEICISMNLIWNAFSMTEWRPDYYIADDYRVMHYNEHMIGNMTEQYLFLGDTDEKFWGKSYPPNILKHHVQYEYSERKLPKFSDDFSRQCYMGSTVTYSCMQLAAYMGFKEMYLLGVDFSYGEEEENVEYGHFYEMEKPEDKSIGYVKAVTLAYQAAKKYADGHGIRIYNATRGGKLEIFKRVDFDSLF